MDTSSSLPALVAEARQGDRGAWDALVERLLPSVCALVHRHGLAEVDGDDVSRTVWLRLADQLGRGHEPGDLWAWVSATARDECVRLLAARTRMTPAADVSGLDDAVPGSDAVTPRRREQASEAFAWRTVHAEPMTRLRDSALEPSAMVRGPGDPGRLLSLAGGGVVLELEVGAGELAGCVHPAQDATVTLHHAGAEDRTVAVDDEGAFRFEGVVSGSVQLVVTTSERALASPWVTI